MVHEQRLTADRQDSNLRARLFRKRTVVETPRTKNSRTVKFTDVECCKLYTPMSIVPTRNALPEGFETHVEAEERRAYKIEVLSGGNKAQQQLAGKLQRCRKGDRCNTGACDVCERLFRLRLLRQLQPILDSRPHWTRASVVTADFLFTPGELADVDLNALRRKISKRFERWSLRNRIVIAGIDISLEPRGQRHRRLAASFVHAG